MKKLLIVFLVILAGIYFLNKNKSPLYQNNNLIEVAKINTSIIDSNIPSDIKREQIKIEPVQEHQLQTLDKKIKIIDDIISTRNDNDPRLDSELKILNSEEKEVITKKYYEQKKEHLNERGLLIFLLGRNISSDNDLLLFNDVIKEKPCSGFDNCSLTYHDTHDEHAGVDETTLVYPQLVALNALKNLIENSSNINLRETAKEIVNKASQSDNLKIKSFALNIISETY